MILKKPYGLLIKHFKLIHLLLTLVAAYLISKSGLVVGFFSDYVANDYSVTVVDNLASQYVSGLVYLLIFLILVTVIALYVLLKYKNKPANFYLLAIIYYVFLLLMMFVAAALIGSLSDGLWETASARQYRDFANIIYLPQYFFVAMFATRAFGFNIKQFDFKNDIKDLELSEQDSELIEINIGFDTTRVERGIRRAIREFTYYFKENKFIFYVGIGICSVFLVYSVVTNYEKVKYSYKQGSVFTYNQFKLKIQDSIITNLNYAGELLSEDKYYLLVRFSVTNQGSKARELDYKNLKIYLGNDVFTPTIDIGSYFLDYAKPYNGEKLAADQELSYLLTYVIDKKYVNRSFAISIHTGFSVKKENYTAKSIVVKLNPVMIEGNTIVRTANLNDEISFAGTYLNNTSLIIRDYELGRKYSYKYETCYKDDCKEYNDFVVADAFLQNKQTLLVLGYSFSLDTTAPYYGSYKSISNFADHFMKVRYRLDGEIKYSDVVVKTPSNLKDKLVLQLPGEIDDASEMDLYITIRDKSYIVKLKS